MEDIFVSKIKRYLFKEEAVLWYGQADTKKIFDKKDIFFIPIGIVIGILMIMFQDYSFTHVLFASYLNIGRFIIKIYCKRNILYVITNNRILIIRDDSGKRIITRYVDRLSNISLSMNKNGIGNIIFGERKFYDIIYGNTFVVLPWISYPYEGAIFYDIPNAKEVYEIIQKISKRS